MKIITQTIIVPKEINKHHIKNLGDFSTLLRDTPYLGQRKDLKKLSITVAIRDIK